MNRFQEYDYKWFKENKPILCEKYEGRFVIIANEKVLGDDYDYFDLFDYATDELKLTEGTFIIQKCSMKTEYIYQNIGFDD